MNSLKTNKGFTLIELLAVIVILAVLILIAMPSVLRMMENARRNTFILEANRIARIAQTAYAEEALYLDANESWCRSLNDLEKEGFLDKDLEGYDGRIEIKRESIDNQKNYDITTTLYMTNGSYSIDGASTDHINDDKFYENTAYFSAEAKTFDDCPCSSAEECCEGDTPATNPTHCTSPTP